MSNLVYTMQQIENAFMYTLEELLLLDEVGYEDSWDIMKEFLDKERLKDNRQQNRHPAMDMHKEDE